jgi:hypothetical protein
MQMNTNIINPFDSLCDDIFITSIDSTNIINLGNKHDNIKGEYYDIYVSKFNFIKLYHGNRLIDSNRINTMCQKYINKTIDFPALIVAHIVDKEYEKDEYVLVDGQHRYSTMKQLFDFNMIDTIFTYKLYKCNSVTELEELFTDINSNIKFDNMFPYKKIGQLLDKIEQYFKTALSSSKNPHPHKFNIDILKEKLSKLKFFETYHNSVDDVFQKILLLNKNINKEIHKKKLENILQVNEKNLLDKIETFHKKNKMYLLFRSDFKWIDELILLL